jgi:hypothetical protein
MAAATPELSKSRNSDVESPQNGQQRQVFPIDGSGFHVIPKSNNPLKLGSNTMDRIGFLPRTSQINNSKSDVEFSANQDGMTNLASQKPQKSRRRFMIRLTSSRGTGLLEKDGAHVCMLNSSLCGF